MSKDKNKSSGGPKHISEILKEAKKTWLKHKTDQFLAGDEFKGIAEECKHVQIVFLYIDGDPQYIRTIFLN